MAIDPSIRGAHLVGSVNLPDAQSVFRTVAGNLGDRSRRTIPLLQPHAAVAPTWATG